MLTKNKLTKQTLGLKYKKWELHLSSIKSTENLLPPFYYLHSFSLLTKFEHKVS